MLSAPFWLYASSLFRRAETRQLQHHQAGESRIINDTNGFAAGISLVIFGIFLWLKGTDIIALIPFILGFMITYKGLEGMQNVINFKKFGYDTSKGVLIISVLVTLLGVLVMMNPFSTAKVLFFMLGLGLFVSGLADFVSDMIFSRQLGKNPGKAKEAAEAQATIQGK